MSVVNKLFRKRIRQTGYFIEISLFAREKTTDETIRSKFRQIDARPILSQVKVRSHAVLTANWEIIVSAALSFDPRAQFSARHRSPFASARAAR